MKEFKWTGDVARMRQ